MTLRTRRIIFYTFTLLFIIVGLGVVFYSQGWRINIQNCKIKSLPRSEDLLLLRGLKDCRVAFQKTGAIFIETQPKGVVIKIDEETFKDKSGLIQSGTLISNLLPKTYRLKVEKSGYLPWVKNALVKSSLVTEFPKIVLIPEKIEKKLVILPKTINNFWLNSQQKIVFKNKENLYFYPSLAETEEKILIQPNKLKGDEFISWSEDNNKIIVRDSKNQTYYLYEINNLSKTFNINATFNNFKKASIEEVAFYPLESNRLIIRDKNDFLYILDTNRFQLENITKEPVLNWKIKSPNLYYIKKTRNTRGSDQRVIRGSLADQRESVYILVSFNLITKTNNFNVELPSQLINQEILEINASGNKIALLTKNGSLYLFNQITQNFNQIAHSAEKFIFSPDNKKIAFLDKDGKLNIYFLEDYQRGIQKKAGEVIGLNLYEGLAVKNIFWYKDSHHLFVDYLDSDGIKKVDFVEIDDRPPINKYTLFEGVSDFYYEPISNRPYFVKESKLYFIEF